MCRFLFLTPHFILSLLSLYRDPSTCPMLSQWHTRYTRTPWKLQVLLTLWMCCMWLKWWRGSWNMSNSCERWETPSCGKWPKCVIFSADVTVFYCLSQLSEVLVEMGSNLMQVDDKILTLAQKEKRACSSIVYSLETLAWPQLHSHAQDFSVVQTIMPSFLNFLNINISFVKGIICQYSFILAIIFLTHAGVQEHCDGGPLNPNSPFHWNNLHCISASGGLNGQPGNRAVRVRPWAATSFPL